MLSEEMHDDRHMDGSLATELRNVISIYNSEF